jgi:uncharacterized protein (DUF2126 family)
MGNMNRTLFSEAAMRILEANPNVEHVLAAVRAYMEGQTPMEIYLVERTLERLLVRLDGNIHPDAVFHSDQGCITPIPKSG